MKKQYIFIIMIAIIIYISYQIISFTYKEYQINSNIEYIKKLTTDVEEKIESAKKIIEYKTSKAYKNKILKEQQSFKNIWEDVIYFTTEENFNKYTTVKEEKPKETAAITTTEKERIKDLNIYEKWLYFLFRIHPDPN